MTYKIHNLDTFIKSTYNDILITEKDIPSKESVSHNDFEMFKKGYDFGVLGLLFGITSKKKMNIMRMDDRSYTQCTYSREQEKDTVFPTLSFVTKNHVNWRLIGNYSDFDANDLSNIIGSNTGLSIMSDELFRLLINCANINPEWFGHDYNIAIPFRCLQLSKRLLNQQPVLNIDPDAITKVTKDIRKLWQIINFSGKESFSWEYDKNNHSIIEPIENVDMGQFCSKIFRASHSNKTNQNFSLQSIIKLDELIEFFEQVFYAKWNPNEKSVELDDTRILLGLNAKNEMELIPFISYYPSKKNHSKNELKILSDLTIRMNQTSMLSQYNSISAMQNNSNRVFNNSDISFINPFRIYPWLKMIENLSKTNSFSTKDVNIIFRVPESLSLPNFNILASIPDYVFGKNDGQDTLISDIIFSISNTNIKNYNKNTEIFELGS